MIYNDAGSSSKFSPFINGDKFRFSSAIRALPESFGFQDDYPYVIPVIQVHVFEVHVFSASRWVSKNRTLVFVLFGEIISKVVLSFANG